MAQDEKLTLLLEARDRASAKLKEVSGNIGRLDNVAGTAAKGVGALMGAFAIGGLAAFVGNVGSAVTEMARLSAQANEVESAFRGMMETGGQSAEGMLDAMRRASGGTIADTDLMLNANRAMMLGVAKNTEEITSLMNVAATRGRAMGMSMTDAFNDIVTGLGRGSALILDNLGIVVNAEQVNAAYAEQLGKTASALTEAEKKQALVNSVMKEAANIEPPDWSTAASDFGRMESSIANAKQALGELFSPAVAAIAQSIANATNEAMDYVNPNRGLSEAQVLQQDLNSALQRYNQLLAQNSGANPYDSSNDRIRDEQRSLAELVVEWNLARMKLNQPIIDYAKFISGAADFEIALQDYNPAAIVAQQMDEARTEANAIMQQMGADAQAFASQNTSIWQALTASMDGLRDDQLRQVGENARAMYAGLTNGGMEAADAMKQTVAWIETTTDTLRDANTALSAAMVGVGALAQELPSLASWLGVSGRAASDTDGALKGLAGSATGAAFGIRDVGSAAAGSIGALHGVGAAGRDAADGMLAAAQAQLRASYLSAVGDLGADEAYRQYKAQSAALDDYADGLKASGDAEFLLAAQVDNANSSLDAQRQALRTAGDAADLYNQRLEDIRSTAQGVLSGSLNLSDIKFPEGPRPDAVNENARRLAAIANEGLGNQDWLEEFKNEVPDIYKALVESGDPRGTAQQMLRDFQDGLVPSLLDKDAAKERVRRMILGDQNMASLANEIAQELSQEMGISLADAQKAAGSALGVSATGESGAAILDGNKEGNRFVDGVSQALATRQQEFYTAGANAGTQWGSGFLIEAEAGVPAALIFMMAGLVKKALDADASASKSRTGAN